MSQSTTNPTQQGRSTTSAPANAPIRKANERPKFGPQHRGPMGGGPMGHGVGTGEKAVNFGPSFRRLLSHLHHERGLIVLVTAFSAIATIFTVSGPKVLAGATDIIFAGIIGKNLPSMLSKQQIIDRLRQAGQDTFADMLQRMNVVPGQGIDFTQLAWVIGTALGLYAVAGVMMWATGYVVNGIVQRSVYRMRQDVAAKLDRLPLKFFDGQPRGELLSRVTNDIDNVAQSLQQTLAQMLNNLFTVVGVVGMMFWISPTLALIALVTIPVAMGVTMVIGQRSQKLFAATWMSTGQLNSTIEEAYTGHSLVKVFGRQREVAAEFQKRNEDLFKAAFGAQFISGIIMPTMFFVGNLNYVVIAVLGGLRVASGTMSLGDVQAFIQYSRQFTQPITQLASMANLLQSGVASAERVFEVLDATEEVPEGNADMPVVRGRVVFDHVTFSYDPTQPLITDLSLVAEPGSTVAIVGPTGAGKTTLVNLIMRFYELQGGRITIDGVDIATVPRRDLRSNIGMVLQDTWLFQGTIHDNIAYGRTDATETEIRAAAEATYVDRFVHSLPQGYDTVIDEEGSNVSAGEKQLITIARAFLADPAILILDEATSSVDTRTEVLVQRAMKALRADRTSFVIAHRLSTIRDADVILVMENGAIVEQGDHASLLAARGAYYRLYQSQFAAANGEE